MARELRVGAGVKPPSKLLLLAEFRAVGELALGLASLPVLASAPRGDGHTVLVLPGFLTYDRVSGENPEHTRPADIEALAGDLPVAATSIYSRTDGIVHWRASRVQPSDNAENIEVRGASHIGLRVNPAVMLAVADRLAQPDGQFTPFGHSGPFSLAYRH